MEKRTAHCKLLFVKALIEAGRVKATATAINGARELGINDLAAMCAVVLSLTPADFHKSMTTHVDHLIWQDVYHAKTAQHGDVYVKLTVVDDVLIVSFNLETGVVRARWCVQTSDWREATTQPTGVGKEKRQSQTLGWTCQRVRSALTHTVRYAKRPALASMRYPRGPEAVNCGF